ncbi:VOC family protein [Spongisporangium articulatum]|uniref:VOC family protein n=1 Tax=Spongisporangium articulatum TaxID=3362603 RepID=A0ABW8ALK2_9ACTN
MQAQNLGLVLPAADVPGAAEFYTAHLGFTAHVVLSWYASLGHPDVPGAFVDLVRTGHPAAGAAQAPAGGARGVMLALLVADVDAEYRRLRAAGLELLTEVTDEPWGQRRFQLQGPDAVVVELVQRTAPDAEWLAANP